MLHILTFRSYMACNLVLIFTGDSNDDMSHLCNYVAGETEDGYGPTFICSSVDFHTTHFSRRLTFPMGLSDWFLSLFNFFTSTGNNFPSCHIKEKIMDATQKQMCRLIVLCNVFIIIYFANSREIDLETFLNVNPTGPIVKVS
jgi:hypothetical protein